MNQLANELGLQYKAIQHHVKVLQRSSIIVPSGVKYGVTYSLSPWMSAHIDIFDEICAKLRFNSDQT
jgi:hypothetical protein